MSSDLHQRLADLAGDVPAPSPGGAGELWAAGKRRHRRRTAASVLAAAALVAGTGSLGLAIPGGVGTADPAAVAPSGTSRLPDHLYAPSPDLAGTAEDGPIGPLAVVIGGQFRHKTDGPSFVGVSAVTGEYSFLDLPGRPETESAETSEVALSADGSQVAYWYGHKDAKRTSEIGVEADGVAVYDTVTGDVKQHAIASPTTLRGESLLWVGDRVVVTAFDALDSHASDGGRTLVWTPKSDALVKLPRILLDSGVTVSGDQVIAGAERSFKRINLADGGTTTRQKLSVLQDGLVSLSPDGTRIATRRDPDAAGTESGRVSPAVVGALQAPRNPGGLGGPIVPSGPIALDTVQLADVAGPSVYSVEGWRDNEHIVVVPEMKGDAGWQYASLDVNSGSLKPLVDSGNNAGSGNYAFASEAWTWPSVHAAEPDWPVDGRLLPAGLAVAALGLGAVAYLVWRRSRVRR